MPCRLLVAGAGSARRIKTRRLAWFVQKRVMEWLCPERLLAARVAWLRRQGARIGDGCRIHSDQILSEPYLVEIGDRVGIAPGTCLVTHDGSAGLRSGMAVFGRISVGDDTYIGCNCVILPGTVIGRDCIVGAGSVVRGTVPDGSVVMGNPAQVVMTTAMVRKLSVKKQNMIKVRGLSPKEIERAVREHFGLDQGG